MEKLTREMATKYFEESGWVCPFCGSNNLLASDDAYFEAEYAWRDIECLACEQKWKDEFSLTAISQGEDDFENEELIKALAKPKIPDYYNYAWVAARKNGWELEQTISRFAVCKKSEDEWCVHSIGLNCLVHGHYGFNTKEDARLFAMTKVFEDDLSNSEVAKIHGTTLHYYTINEDGFLAELKMDDEEYQYRFSMENIVEINNHQKGSWTIKFKRDSGMVEAFNIKFYVLAQSGVEIAQEVD